MLLEPLPSAGRHVSQAARRLARRQEALRQRLQVIEPVAQRRDAHLRACQTVVQVFAKIPAFDLRAQVAIRSRYDAHVYRNWRAVAHATHLTFFEDAQQLRLKCLR
jgi:hypothetical protein